MTGSGNRAAAALAALILAAPAAGQGLAPPSCDYGEMNPDAPPELARFDFLIGDYTVEAAGLRGGEWTTRPGAPPARWNGRWILGGMAIEDEWFDADPGLDPRSARGVNVRMWDPQAGEFDMMWVYDGTHQVQDLRAREIDGVLTMWQVYPERPDFRATFHRLPDGAWERITLAPDENGEWRPTVRLRATPVACLD